jgi:hypothetical protein
MVETGEPKPRQTEGEPQLIDWREDIAQTESDRLNEIVTVECGPDPKSIAINRAYTVALEARTGIKHIARFRSSFSPIKEEPQEILAVNFAYGLVGDIEKLCTFSREPAAQSKSSLGFIYGDMIKVDAISHNGRTRGIQERALLRKVEEKDTPTSRRVNDILDVGAHDARAYFLEGKVASDPLIRLLILISLAGDYGFLNRLCEPGHWQRGRGSWLDKSPRVYPNAMDIRESIRHEGEFWQSLGKISLAQK